MWDVRGWDRLTVRDDPPLLGAKQEFLSWLTEVPEPTQSKWRGRLKSKLDHSHLSVRLELYLHHYFKSAGWAVEIEPEMPESPNKPDLRAARDTDQILVEAKAVLDEQTIAQGTQRLNQLAENLTRKLSRDVIIKPLSDLPSNLPARKIRYQIEQRAKTQTAELLEFDLADQYQGAPYALKIIMLPKGSDASEPGSVGGTISDAYKLAPGTRIRYALEQKASNYGPIEAPFLIAVYGAGEFPTSLGDEDDALLGDREWLVPVMGVGGVTERRKRNGFFTSEQGGERRHVDVSAVLFYRFKWLDDTHVHLAHIYHNPWAQRPINPDLFPGVPQMARGDDGQMNWVNGEPES